MGELSLQDPDFRRWWGAHRVAVQGTGTKVLNHPIAGQLTLARLVLPHLRTSRRPPRGRPLDAGYSPAAGGAGW
ncbi:MmyB family transcriptional regulator [Streptomyces mirabilis]|uniref:MmyB family transcriptional regulator n=1 Tax=Streptomyces mirabilis TaxID=68239 RepID=UPI0036DB064E